MRRILARVAKARSLGEQPEGVLPGGIDGRPMSII
jgi:hypothetical protein